MQSGRLTDPRGYAGADALSGAGLSGPLSRAELIAWMRAALEVGNDSAVIAALADAPSPATYRALWEALGVALEGGAGADAAQRALVTRIFALPVLVVTGGEAGVNVPMVLPSVDRVRALLQEKGTLGQARNFGLASALCAAEALEGVAPSRQYRIASGLEEAAGALDLPPADLLTTTEHEAVHLRFLAGVAVTPAQAPSFLETGADVGAWGLALTRELSEQLRVPGLSVLPIPRPPANLFQAPALGRQAREELALQAFVSRVLRRFRAEVGEPAVTIASLASGEVGVRFASPFDPARVEVHRWRLTPLDEIGRVQDGIAGLLRECRVGGVTELSSILTIEQLTAGAAPRAH